MYETADGRHMAVGALEFWHLLAEALSGGRTSSPAIWPRGWRARACAPSWPAIFRGRSQHDWVAIFDAVDCCDRPVLRTEKSLEDAQLQARGMVVEVSGMPQFGPGGAHGGVPSAAARCRTGLGRYEHRCDPRPSAGVDGDDRAAARGGRDLIWTDGAERKRLNEQG